MKHYVYIYTNPSRNNEPFYVGMGKDGRYRRHFTRVDRHPMTHRMNLLKEQGVVPCVAFICTQIDSEFAALIEQEAIAKYGRKDLGKGPLLNLTDGGDGCNNPSPETRKRMAISATGVVQSQETIERRVQKLRGVARPQHVIDAMVKANTGAKRTEESKKRMSDSHKGKTLSVEQKAKISESLKAAHARKKNGK